LFDYGLLIALAIFLILVVYIPYAYILYKYHKQAREVLALSLWSDGCDARVKLLLAANIRCKFTYDPVMMRCDDCSLAPLCGFVGQVRVPDATAVAEYVP